MSKLLQKYQLEMVILKKKIAIEKAKEDLAKTISLNKKPMNDETTPQAPESTPEPEDSI